MHNPQNNQNNSQNANQNNNPGAHITSNHTPASSNQFRQYDQQNQQQSQNQFNPSQQQQQQFNANYNQQTQFCNGSPGGRGEFAQNFGQATPPQFQNPSTFVPPQNFHVPNTQFQLNSNQIRSEVGS